MGWRVEALFADFTNPDGSRRRADSRFDHPSDLSEQLRSALIPFDPINRDPSERDQARAKRAPDLDPAR